MSEWFAAYVIVALLLIGVNTALLDFNASPDDSDIGAILLISILWPIAVSVTVVCIVTKFIAREL